MDDRGLDRAVYLPESPARPHVSAELFAGLAAQGLLQVFTSLDVPAEQVPHVREDTNPRGPVYEQQRTVPHHGSRATHTAGASLTARDSSEREGRMAAPDRARERAAPGAGAPGDGRGWRMGADTCAGESS